MQENKRQHPRTEVHLPGVICFDGNTHPVVIKDISLGGCMIEGDIRISPDQIVTLSLDGGITGVEFQARVAWQTSQNGPERLGVCFWDMDPERKALLMESVLLHARRQAESFEDADSSESQDSGR